VSGSKHDAFLASVWWWAGSYERKTAANAEWWMARP